MEAGMKRFIFDALLDEQNICNLAEEREKITQGIEHGLKLLVYGRRNTGKTSLVKNAGAPDWKRRHPSGLFMYVDLLGVKTLSHISERVTVAFSEAYNACFQMKSVFDKMLKVIMGLRPTITLDDTGRPTLSVGIGVGEAPRPFSDILKQLDRIHASNVPVLLVMDEFQDIAMVEEAEAILRRDLENLDSKIPVVVLGSKHHLLERIFARPAAPFFNWGTHVHFDAIPYRDYWRYMQERFEPQGLRISFENARHLQDLMSRVPEAINRLCYALMFGGAFGGKLSKEAIETGLEKLVQERRNEPEKYLSGFTAAEQRVITALSKEQPVPHPQGKDFIRRTGLTASGIRKILMKLEDQAVVYREEAGYILADPLLRQHVLRFRL
jgi:hypothetical protein